MRLFAAIRPPDEVLDHLDLALGAVRGTLPGGADGPVRWSARETWHVTVAFYGEVPDGAVPALDDALADAARGTPPYQLHLRGAGAFAHRTLWVGVAADLAPHRALGAASVAAGVVVRGARADDETALDTRSRPHLTVGRAARPARPQRPEGRRGRTADRDGPGLSALVHALAVYEGPSWTVEKLLLVQSQPGAGRGGGPLYTNRGEHRLG